MTISKRLVFALLPLVLIVAAGELTQRVRLTLRYRSVFWLAYGLGPSAFELTRDAAIRADPSGRVIIARTEPLACPDSAMTAAKVIFSVGGSSTYGISADRSYPSVLQEQLNALSGRPEFVVCNLGKPKAEAVEYAPLVSSQLRRVRPRLAIFYTGYNDIYMPAMNINPDRWSRLESVAVRMTDELQQRSVLALTAIEKYSIWREMRWPRRRDPSAVTQREALFRTNLAAVVTMLRREGIDVVLVPEVVMDNRLFDGIVRHPDFELRWYQNIPPLVRAVADDTGAEFVSLQDGFEERDVKRYFMDPVHLTEDGFRRLVELLMERSQLLAKVLRG